MPTPPNILLIHSDQHRYDCVGANGHPFIQTPNLDRLAAEGVNFRHAFTPQPICSPARNSLHYGRWPTQHHVIANFDTEFALPAPEGMTTWSEALRDAGYFLGYVGKWGVHPARTPLDFGYHEYVPDAQYSRWRAAQGIPPAPKASGWMGETDHHVTPEQSRLAWGANEAMRLLEEAASRREESGRPFFLRWDPTEPHLPHILPEPYASMYPPEEIPPWPGFPDPLEGKPYIQAQQRRSWQVDGWGWEQWQPLVSRYLGTVTQLDTQIGRILEALERLGLAENTLVAYTCDHGNLSGSHGMIDKHYVLYDDVTRVPLIVRWPGRTKAAGSVCESFVSQEIDLAATFCEAVGVPIPRGFAGQSLVPLLTGEQIDNGRTDIFAQYMGNQFGLYSQRMVRDARWKYIWNAVAEDELYDLDTDPGEITNRATDPGCRTELRRLRARLVAWMESIGDPLLNQWTLPQLLEDRTV